MNEPVAGIVLLVLEDGTRCYLGPPDEEDTARLLLGPSGAHVFCERPRHNMQDMVNPWSDVTMERFGLLVEKAHFIELYHLQASFLFQRVIL
jgi:hypothetical protein